MKRLQISIDMLHTQAQRARHEGRAIEALMLLKRAGDYSSMAVETTRAAVEKDAGLYAESEARYRRVIKKAEDLGHKRSLVYALNGLAATLRAVKRYDEAHDVIKRARRLAPANIEVSVTYAAILRDIANLAQSAELRAQSLGMLEEAGEA